MELADIVLLQQLEFDLMAMKEELLRKSCASEEVSRMVVAIEMMRVVIEGQKRVTNLYRDTSDEAEKIARIHKQAKHEMLQRYREAWLIAKEGGSMIQDRIPADGNHRIT